MTTPTPPAWRNKLYFGDNLPIMREHIPDESVDLIYVLLPPFSLSRESRSLLTRPTIRVS